MPAVVTRRPHTKSRLGCIQCKARKVKCDQASPSCSACVRRVESCSLLDVRPNKASIKKKAVSLTTRAVDSHSPESGISPQSSNVSIHIHESLPIDVELTHLFATRTWNTLMVRPDAADLWRTTLFELALANPPFLDAILATAAMHKLALDTESPKNHIYIDLIKRKASNLISFMLSMLRAPSDETSVLLFASSVLFTIWAFSSEHFFAEAELFATPSFADAVSSPLDLGQTVNGISMPHLDNLLSVLNICLGGKYIATELRPSRTNANFLVLTAAPQNYELLPPVPADINLALDLLDVHWRAKSPPSEQAAFYEKNMRLLRELFQIQQVPEWHDMIVGFVIRFEKGMIRLLASRDQCAMVILAYWTAVLREVEGSCWWLRGWADEIYDEIEEVLEPEWKTHLRVFSRFLPRHGSMA